MLATQALLPPAQSGGSEASARSHPPAPRRSIKATEPKVRERKEAAVRARNARNQHLHRQRQKVTPLPIAKHRACLTEETTERVKHLPLPLQPAT